MDKNHFLKILRQLLEKAKKNQVNWSVWNDEDSATDAYQVQFSDDSRIVVKFESPDAEPDRATAFLYVKHDVVTEMLVEDGGPDYELIHSLYKEAQRATMGWDVEIEAIERQLAGDGEVGLQVSQS